jgi:hypothetical protein
VLERTSSEAGGGGDRLDGADGIDTADHGGSPAGVIVKLATGAVSGGDAQGDSLVAFFGEGLKRSRREMFAFLLVFLVVLQCRSIFSIRDFWEVHLKQ